MLYDSLHTKLLLLADATLVYPAHGAGSLCGKALSQETVTTMGEQRRFNYALQPMGKQAFVDLVTADQPDAPPYFWYDAVLNTKERQTLDEALSRELTPLTLGQVQELQARDVQVLDTREPTEFASAHLAGSLNIGLDGQFATWAGTVLDHEHRIVIVADPGREREAALRLGRIGFDRVAGFLDSGMLSLHDRSDPTVSSERISPQLAAVQTTSAKPPLLVDVRTPNEYGGTHVKGSLNVPLSRLSQWDGPPADRPVVVLCAGGYRSSIAASMLQRRGITQVSEVAGGLMAWEAAQLPVESGGATQ